MSDWILFSKLAAVVGDNVFIAQNGVKTVGIIITIGIIKTSINGGKNETA